MMRIDLPCCNFKYCRRCFDGNCIADENCRKNCDYLILQEQQLNNGWISVESKGLPNHRRYEDGTPIEFPVMIKGAIYPTMLCIDDNGNWFDEVGREYGIKALENYKFEVVAWKNPTEPYMEESK